MYKRGRISDTRDKDIIFDDINNQNHQINHHNSNGLIFEDSNSTDVDISSADGGFPFDDTEHEPRRFMPTERFVIFK